MVRYELEKQMFAGTITAHDLPAAWNRLYKSTWAWMSPSDREGVLQDSHWANGNIGYFPSYAIGSAYGAQYLLEMQKDLDGGRRPLRQAHRHQSLAGGEDLEVRLHEGPRGPLRVRLRTLPSEEYVAYLEKSSRTYTNCNFLQR